jgi:hypothetical protein
LRARETTFRPTIRSSINIEKSVLLLETKPRDLGLGGFHGFVRVVTIVGLVRGAVVVIALGEDEDVIAATEGVLEDGGGAQVDVGVISRSLVGGGTVKVPDTELANVRDLLAHGLMVRKESILVNRWGRVGLTVVFERRPLSPSIQTSERG